VTVPECQNCGSFVTSQYARVLSPEDVDDPRVCPHCEDRIREGAEVREARSPRQ
jgi:DNA-directed RNA polymerase subunit RPC12/RpoP